MEIAQRVWWVGSVLDDPFQCHAYLIDAGRDSVLIDPGSSLTIDDTIRKVGEVMSLDDVRYVIVHHADPDVADGLHQLERLISRPDAVVVTEWRSELLLRHLKLSVTFDTIEHLGYQLTLDDGRRLEFALTPYLHFPGAFVTFDSSTRTLFSSDLFGGFNRTRKLWATDSDDFEDLRQFHEHYMPSREILMAGLAGIRARFPDIEQVCPQHGYLIGPSLVRPMFDQLNQLECGVLLLSHSNCDLAGILTLASTIRNIEQILSTSAGFRQLAELAVTQLRAVIPASLVALEASISGRVIRFAPDSDLEGTEQPGFTPASPTELVITLPADGDDPPAQCTIALDHPVTGGPTSVHELLGLLGPRLRHLLREALDQRDAAAAIHELEQSVYLDPLTGLYNRRYLDDHRPSTRQLAALMIDIDHFKKVNDTFGHPAGDIVLRDVARTIADNVRPSDIVIRWGGEEILVLTELDHTDPVDLLTTIAARLNTSIAAHHHPVLDNQAVTISVGGTPADARDTIERLIARADAALYTAKANGRNRAEIASAAA